MNVVKGCALHKSRAKGGGAKVDGAKGCLERGKKKKPQLVQGARRVFGPNQPPEKNGGGPAWSRRHFEEKKEGGGKSNTGGKISTKGAS